MHFCASLLHIRMITKLQTFLSALNSWKHLKQNNGANRLVTYPEFFSIYICIYEKRKGIYGVVFLEIWLKWLEGKQELCILVPIKGSNEPTREWNDILPSFSGGCGAAQGCKRFEWDCNCILIESPSGPCTWVVNTYLLAWLILQGGTRSYHARLVPRTIDNKCWWEKSQVRI